MIKFFRHIRKSLLLENKTSKYFKYAIGEIILVVIGILIALQVNNWNEQRKDFQKKNQFLIALKAEFNANLNQLDSVLYYDNRVKNGVFWLLQLEEEHLQNQSIDSLRFYIQESGWTWTFDPINGALRSGISSGEIHLISNSKLKNLLFGWQDVVADAKENENRLIKQREEFGLINNKNVRTRDWLRLYLPVMGESRYISNYYLLNKDPLFEDYISQRFVYVEDALSELLVVRQQNMLILDLIENEFK